MDNRELCLPGDIVQTYNMTYIFKVQQADHVWDYYRHHRIVRDSLNKHTLKKFPASVIVIFH